MTPRTITIGNKIADIIVADVKIKYNIKPDRQKIPINGNQGENGTLNGLGLSGSTFLKISTAIQTIINDVNAP